MSSPPLDCYILVGENSDPTQLCTETMLVVELSFTLIVYFHVEVDARHMLDPSHKIREAARAVAPH